MGAGLFRFAGAARLALSEGVELPAGTGRVSTTAVVHAGIVLALALALGALLLRTLATGHAPWSNLHEFTAAFATGVMVIYLYLDRGQRIRGLAPVAAAFAAAAGELLQSSSRGSISWLPSADDCRAAADRSVLLAFPVLTIAIVLGSVWANLAWRSYWSNDPKELAAAATWLVYGAYFHVAGRRDRWARIAPWLLLLGFVGVLFTYLAAGLIFVGEHSYANP